MGWQKDRRLKAGGWWECRVKRQAFNSTRQTDEQRREALLQRRRDQYDSDWRFRIGERLKSDARARRRNLIERRRKQALAEEA